MNDLTEIALDALEREESKDAGDEQDTTNDGADEKDTSNAGDGGDNDAEDEDDSESENTDEKDGGESDDDKSDGDDKDEDNDDDDSDDKDESDDDTESKKKTKKSDEMTDEEFEELAKKRGYSKKSEDKSDDDEKKKAEDDAKRRMDAINAIPKPKELDADTWSAMPPMNKVIYSRLPYITAHGKDGDVKIKTPEQLPDEFEFASDKARSQFMNDIQAQEAQAQQMANAIQGQARQQQMTSQQQARARAIISEVSALQESGDLPKPTTEPNTPEFDNDPAVKTINKVLNYQMTRARQGVNLSVRDALLLYRAEHPEDFKKPEDTKAKGDDERKKIAKKVAGNNKSTNKSAADETAGNKRKYYRPGMSTQDVLDRALQDLD